MRNVRQFLVLFLALIAVAAAGRAISKSQPEFDKIKSLAGNWEGKATDGNAVHINYKVVSGGTAVMESIEAGADHQMVTLYYLDGDHLMMTHFCMANNQPRMRADASTSSPSAIKFKFVDATNLSSPEAGHISGRIPGTLLSTGLGGSKARRKRRPLNCSGRNRERPASATHPLPPAQNGCFTQRREEFPRAASFVLGGARENARGERLHAASIYYRGPLTPNP
jgi:hypothetical protein